MRRRLLRTKPLYLLRKLVGLSRREWFDLLRAQGELIRAQVLVWTSPVGQLTARAAESTAGDAVQGSEPAARRWALAVSRAASYGIFRPLCLVRALALQKLLESHGLGGSRVCVGVRRQKGVFAAHAWVEYGELLLGDEEAHVRAFAPLTSVAVRASQ